jgi:hypothetical protein
MEPRALRDQKYDIGKCAVFITDRWDGSTNLFEAGSCPA